MHTARAQCTGTKKYKINSVLLLTFNFHRQYMVRLQNDNRRARETKTTENLHTYSLILENESHDFCHDGVAYTNSILPHTVFLCFNFRCCCYCWCYCCWCWHLRLKLSKVSICNFGEDRITPRCSSIVAVYFYFCRHTHTQTQLRQRQGQTIKYTFSNRFLFVFFSFLFVSFSLFRFFCCTIHVDIMRTQIHQWQNRMQRTNWSS